MGEYLPGRSVHHQTAPAHHQNPACQGSLFHMMGNQQYGNARLPVQVPDTFQHLPAAQRIQHGGGFIKDNTLGPHGQHSGNSHPLLLSAGQPVGGRFGIGRHPHLGQAFLHPLPDFPGGHTYVFRPETHILFYHRGYNLVVRVLKDHAGHGADIPKPLCLSRIHILNPNGPLRGSQ